MCESESGYMLSVPAVEDLMIQDTLNSNSFAIVV